MEQAKRKRIPFMLIFTVIGITTAISSIIIFAVLYFLLQPQQTTSSPYLQGNPDGVRELAQSRTLIDFSFPAHTGESLSLSSLQGKPILLFFGYTHCPDVCLITLSDMKKVHENLGDMAKDVSFVFISVDGERDTPERLAEYFYYQRVGDWLIGLSGDDGTLQRISVDYGLYYDLVLEEADENNNYPVDHTASIYLVNSEGELVTIFVYGTLPEYITEQVIAQID